MVYHDLFWARKVSLLFHAKQVFLYKF